VLGHGGGYIRGVVFGGFQLGNKPGLGGLQTRHTMCTQAGVRFIGGGPGGWGWGGMSVNRGPGCGVWGGKMVLFQRGY